MTTADSDGLGRELAALAANVGPLLTPPHADELLQSVAEVARQLFDAAACSIALLDESTEELVFAVTVGAGAESVLGVRVPVQQGIAGYVVTTGQSIAIEDVTADPRFARDVAESTGYVPRSILAAPLETGAGTIGVIEVLDRGAESGTVELLLLFAQQAALAIESAKVFADLGRVLFQAAGKRASAGGLRDALLAVAEEAPGPDADLAELAALIVELGELGERERRSAVRIVRDFTEYARSQRPR
jgi:GAF domain-containing protein